MEPSGDETLTSEMVANVVRKFYDKAFFDPMIGHFFFNLDHDYLIKMQTQFTLNMLGVEKNSYEGKPLKNAHSRLPLTNVHFNRRQVLMKEVLAESSVSLKIQEYWLNLEERLRPVIVNSLTNCRK